MQMFCLHLQYQGAGATGIAQFDDLNAIGGATGGNVATEDDLFLEPFHHY